MSTVIRVENLWKRYYLSHKDRESFPTLRDKIAHAALNMGKRLLHPLRASSGQPLEGLDSTEEFWALADVSFDVRQGDRVGIIGRNGAGKSTLLKILSRITEPTRGRVSITGRVASLLEVGTGFHPELTGRENIFLNGAILGMSRVDIRRKFDEIVAFGEIEKFLDTPIKRYSSGMYVRLAFAVAAHLEPEILIVDEVLAVGDAQFQKKCLGKMEKVGQEGRTVLFVSHNMAAVRALCSNVIVLEEGRITYSGGVEESVSRYMETVIDETSFERTWNKPESAPGNEYLQLRRVGIVARDGSPPESLSIRSPVDIEIEFWNKKPDARLSISMHVMTQDGVIAFASTTWQESIWDGKCFQLGLYKSKCQLPGDLLNVGPYRICLFFIENSRNVLCKIEDTLTFQLLDSDHDRGEWHGKWDGVMRPNLEWSTELLSPFLLMKPGETVEMIYSRDELEQIGFARIGENVTIHKTVELFSPNRISLGDNVRIDCFSLLSAGEEGIHIGNNVHLAASAYIFGSGGKVILENFAGFASRVSLYTASDDYSEGFLTNPTVPDKYKKVTRGPVTLRKHAIIGVGSVIMPNVEIGIGASIGALTFVNKNIEKFSIGCGNPVKIVGKRSESILENEKAYLDGIGQV